MSADLKPNESTPAAHEKDVEVGHASTYSEDAKVADLSAEHREYVLQRHGTLNLEPLPSIDPADPYNWVDWRKNVNLVLVAFHAMMAIFTAAAIIPAYEAIAEELHVSIQQASYLTSVMIVVLGCSPLVWKPLANRFGRRPVWLVSTAGSCVLNIGCANIHSYGVMIFVRMLEAFFISPALAIGSGVVVETFFANKRGQKVGLWALMVTIGAPGGPFIMGFVAQHLGWRWIYWLLAIINGVQFVLYVFFGPETRYFPPHDSDTRTAVQREYWSFSKRGPDALKAKDFLQPLVLAKYPSVVLPTIAYAMVFGFASIMLTVEIPQVFGLKFHLNPQQIGLQFISLIIGSVLGEQAGGPFSDYLRMRYVKRHGNAPPPESRLWLSYFGFLTVIVGLLVFGIQLGNASATWNVTPLIGVGIASFGNQLITTVLVTYAVDSVPQHASSVGVFVNLVRSTWGFTCPFWLPQSFETMGDAGAVGMMVGLVFAVAVLPTALVQWKGPQWRRRGAAAETES